jgi:hypothetical protein
MLMNHGQSGFGLEFVEGCLTVAAMVFAFALPRMGSKAFQAVERLFADIARKRHQSIFLVGLSTIVLRVAMLPLLPIPLPFVPDDFSFLLSADTFLHGRLTNPTPALWTHFETIHVTMRPTYASMYFPAEGLLLAASKAIFGHPWFGILGVTALMCAAICWMLQAWVPPQWALLGGLLATLHLGLFSYWVNTYAGGGSIAGLGGALILGALPRILRRVQSRHLLLLAVGVVLVGFTRPYEGTLLCVPVAIRLGIWLARGKNLPSKGMLLKMAALPLALIIGAVGWLGYYDYRNFGSATTLPYTVDRATYAIAPYFIWQKPRPEPHYRLASIRRFYEQEAVPYVPSRSLERILLDRLFTAVAEARFFCGIAFLPLLFALPLALRDRRMRFPAILLSVLAVGVIPEIYLIPHYLAPFTAVFYCLGIQTMRHVRTWTIQRTLVGPAVLRMAVLVCVVIVMIRPFDQVLELAVRERPPSEWNALWYGPDQYGQARASIEKRLQAIPGNQIVIVRYASSHWTLDQWVYNSADIDHSKVIWANDMGADENQKLIDHYSDRKIWLVQPDLSPLVIVPYSSRLEDALLPQATKESATR